MTIQPRWEFARKHPNSPQIEPYSDELFGLSAPVDKLVRESIQNSLDARAGTEPVRIRFTIPSEAIPSATTSPWLASLKPHLSAEDNGLVEACSLNSSLSILIIEDYGTCGLTGDPKQTDDKAEGWKGRKNNFFYFWRAVGVTGKGEGDKGSWGLGKSVIPASSGLHTFFGVSCEELGGTPRLLGLSVLKHHTIEGRTFTPYGYFGHYDFQDSPVMPVIDEDTVTAFCDHFGVMRQGKPGLSLVVLEPHKLAFSGPPLMASAAINYFFPILEGHLVVEVVVGDKITVIDAASLCGCESFITPQMLEEHGIESATLRDLLALARWSIEQQRVAAIRLNPPSEIARPRWDDAVFSVDGWDEALIRFTAGEPVEFIVPAWVIPKVGPPEVAEFFVCMKKIPSDQKPKSFYLRDGITIGKTSDRGERGIVAFTSVESGALAKFLRLSEDPSHTKWRERGGRLGEHYRNPQPLVSFVKNSIKEIHDRLSRAKEGIDTDLLADLFFLDDEPDGSVENSTPSGRGTRPQKARVPAINADIQAVRIANRGNGIVIVGVPPAAVVGQIIRVRFAYDVRRGNAFTKWSPLDFDLTDLKNQIEWNGAMRLEAKGNTLEFAVERPDFEVLLNGFDSERDVRVEANVVTNP